MSQLKHANKNDLGGQWQYGRGAKSGEKQG
jgi:hypothetical protein